MPAPRASNTDSGTPSRSGSMEATTPSRRRPPRHAWNFLSVLRSSSFASYGRLGSSRVAIAKTRRACDEYSSTTLNISSFAANVISCTLPSSARRSVQCSTMKFGAPLHTARYFVSEPRGIPPVQSSLRPETSQTVSIIFREDENGTSRTRGYSPAAPSAKPTFLAATTMGASEELPRGSYFSSPVSSSRTLHNVVLQQRMAESNAERTARSPAASAPVLALVIPPTEGSKPFPLTR
mmetsp:Transcript_88418/g.254991  ORF Transcript_88418/g.254991 Transcript_88418/m.254991 type:complete len:237 (-) Transcript_88418:566-1276(-)